MRPQRGRGARAKKEIERFRFTRFLLPFRRAKKKAILPQGPKTRQYTKKTSIFPSLRIA
jgi:hypothetical protein